MNKQQAMQLKQQLMLLGQSSRFAEAEVLAQKILQHSPADWDVWFALAQIQRAMGKLPDAAQAFKKASHRKAKQADKALESYIHLCEQLKDYDAGYKAAQEYVKKHASSATAHFMLGYFAWQCQYEKQAAEHLERAVKLDPSNPGFHLNWGDALVYLGRIDEAIGFYESAKAADSSSDVPWFKSLFAQNYSDQIDDEQLFQAHVEVGKRLEERYPDVPTLHSKSGERIRLGYVSKDFKQHAVASFFEPLLAAHDRSRFEIFCYADVSAVDSDAKTEDFKALAEHWRDVSGMDHVSLANTIRKDGVDILVDLVGYAGKTRMEVFAMRAAPVQISYLGYANTTGLSRMDYRITDAFCDPSGQNEAWHTEKLIRLPEGFLCYQANPDLPDVGPSPGLESAKVTFGSFNVFPKVRPAMLETWAAILRHSPDFRLYLKAKSFADKHMQRSVSKQFEEKGVSAEQLVFKGRTNGYLEHMSEYNKVDIHLDTYPYNGTTTSCDALWMGVPSVTLCGESHRSRVTASILKQVGLKQFIASSAEEYRDIAIAQAEDLQALNALRLQMRQSMVQSSLMNPANLTQEIERAYLACLQEQGINPGQV